MRTATCFFFFKKRPFVLFFLSSVTNLPLTNLLVMFWLTIYTSLSSQHIRHFTQLKHETALVKVQNDILRALDSRHSLILLLLDLSAAFNAVEHSILLSRLSTSFVIRGTVLSWFWTYVTSRKQYVCLEGCKSSLHSLDRGVPQTSPLGKIIRRHNLQYHLYADLRLLQT